MHPSDAQDKKSKWRIPGIGHSKDPKTEPVNRNSASDSTYGSEPSNSLNNAPSLTGSDASRNTQPQYEKNDQGQVVTTTTTTTTTTTSGGGPQQATTKSDPGQTSTSGEDGGPPIPVRSSMRERSPNPGAGHGSINRERSPSMTSPTNGRSNFSYPSRTPPPQSFQASGPNQHGMQPTQQSMAQDQQDVMRGQQQTMAGQQSTLSNLKSAAVGIHVSSVQPEITYVVMDPWLIPFSRYCRAQGRHSVAPSIPPSIAASRPPLSKSQLTIKSCRQDGKRLRVAE